MAKINWTREAEYWLKDIFDYIATENPKAAVAVIEGIYQKTQNLQLFPKSGYRYEAENDREVRILLYGHYRIAYLIKSNKDIDILGVFHSALDINHYLF